VTLETRAVVSLETRAVVTILPKTVVKRPALMYLELAYLMLSWLLRSTSWLVVSVSGLIEREKADRGTVSM
jgi:hypothetical protein